MLSRESKQKKIAALEAAVADSGVLVLAENTGLSAAEMAELRDAARACGGRAQVVKNTLAKRVLAGGKFQSVAETLSGPLVYGTGEDAAAVAKVFVKTAEGNPKLVIRGGALPGKDKMSGQSVEALASLPGREQLLAQLAATLQSPAATLARLLGEIPASLARSLAAVRDQK